MKECKQKDSSAGYATREKETTEKMMRAMRWPQNRFDITINAFSRIVRSTVSASSFRGPSIIHCSDVTTSKLADTDITRLKRARM